MLGGAGSHGLRKCSQRLAFEGEMAAALQRLLQTKFRKGPATDPAGRLRTGKAKPEIGYVSIAFLRVFHCMRSQRTRQRACAVLMECLGKA